MGIFAVRCYFKSMIFPLPILGIFSLILPISLKVRLNSLAIMALFFLAERAARAVEEGGQPRCDGLGPPFDRQPRAHRPHSCFKRIVRDSAAER